MDRGAEAGTIPGRRIKLGVFVHLGTNDPVDSTFGDDGMKGYTPKNGTLRTRRNVS
jgi:hypothetical protein